MAPLATPMLWTPCTKRVWWKMKRHELIKLGSMSLHLIMWSSNWAQRVFVRCRESKRDWNDETRGGPPFAHRRILKSQLPAQKRRVAEHLQQFRRGWRPAPECVSRRAGSYLSARRGSFRVRWIGGERAARDVLVAINPRTATASVHFWPERLIR